MLYIFCIWDSTSVYQLLISQFKFTCVMSVAAKDLQIRHDGSFHSLSWNSDFECFCM